MKQKITVRLLSDEDEKFFGKGVAELLHKVEEFGSLNKAAKAMNLSYTKAWHMLNKTEEIMGFQFVERTSGGTHGGGSELTDKGKEFVRQFDRYNQKMLEMSEDFFQKSFLFDQRYSWSSITTGENAIVVRGGGDIATGTIHRLHSCGFRIVILECAKPTAIRRKVAFCEAVYDGVAEVEGVTCRKVENMEECREAWKNDEIPLFVDEKAEMLQELRPSVVIDAILAKKNLGTNRDMANLTIALGPGFTAGEDVDYVVETMRGHDLGRVITKDAALPNTGTPGLVGGYGKERVIHAPATGQIRNLAKISDKVEKDQVLAYIGETPVKATIDGVLRGIIRDGFEVKKGLKIADIDPRISEQKNCFTISDKARCIAGSVLEVVLMNSYPENR